MIDSTFGYFHFRDLEFEPSGSEVTLNPTSFKSKMASSVKRLCFTLNGQNNLSGHFDEREKDIMWD